MAELFVDFVTQESPFILIVQEESVSEFFLFYVKSISQPSFHQYLKNHNVI